MTPSQARQVIDHGIRQIAFSGILRHRLGAVALAHFLALLVQNRRQVRIDRRLFAQRTKHINPARRIVDVVITTNHMANVHVDVIYDDTEVIRRGAIGACNHQIVQFVIGKFNPTFDLVIPRYNAV